MVGGGQGVGGGLKRRRWTGEAADWGGGGGVGGDAVMAGDGLEPRVGRVRVGPRRRRIDWIRYDPRGILVSLVGENL